ncbi:MAG: hypothetical protein R2911_45405 [Caldilineaceae bacterium]
MLHRPRVLAEYRYAKREMKGTVHDYFANNPYARPQNLEITLDTIAHTPQANALLIAGFLRSAGFLRIEITLEITGNKIWARMNADFR